MLPRNYEVLIEQAYRAIEFYVRLYDAIQSVYDPQLSESEPLDPVDELEVETNIRELAALLPFVIEDEVDRSPLPPGLYTVIANRGQTVNWEEMTGSCWFLLVSTLRRSGLDALHNARVREQAEEIESHCDEQAAKELIEQLLAHTEYATLAGLLDGDLPHVIGCGITDLSQLRKIDPERLKAEVEVELVLAHSLCSDNAEAPVVRVGKGPSFRAPACPSCKSDQTFVHGTKGDVRYCKCKACQHSWQTQASR